MFGHVGSGDGMAGRPCRRDRRFVFYTSSGGVRRHRCFLRRANRDLAPRPRAPNRNRAARSLIQAANFKKRQNVLRAIRRPSRQTIMIGLFQRTAAMNRDKTTITHT